MCHRCRTSRGSHSPLHWLLSDRNASEMFVPNPGAGVNRWLAPSHAPGGADQMADLSFKSLGIGLASSLLAGAISVAAATGVGASTAGADHPAGSYVYTESNQTSAGGGNSVLAFWVASGGSLTSIDTFATGGDGTGAGLGSQGAVTLAGAGPALLVVNAGSNTVSYFRILSNGSLRLVDIAPSGGTDPVSVTASGRRVAVLNQGSKTVASLVLTS